MKYNLSLKEDEASSSTITTAIIVPVMAIVMILAASAVPYSSYVHLGKAKDYDVSAVASEVLQKFADSTGYEPEHGSEWTEADSYEKIKDLGLKADDREIAEDLEDDEEELNNDPANSKPVALDDEVLMNFNESDLPNPSASIDVLDNDYDLEDGTPEFYAVTEDPQHGKVSVEYSLPGDTGLESGALAEAETLPGDDDGCDAYCTLYCPCGTVSGSCGCACSGCPLEPLEPVQEDFTFCGDGTCDPDEDCSICPEDCGSCTEPTFCGDGTCDPDENCSTCSADCGECPPECGNGICEAGEDAVSCPADCSGCGDGTCDPDENCESCSRDCGECSSDFYGLVYSPDITINPDGSIDYPTQDTFEYMVIDSGGLTDKATVTIYISFESSPVAVDDISETDEDTAVDIDVLANDNGMALSIDSVGSPVNGNAVISGGLITYTPDSGFVGKDQFDYTAVDFEGKTTSATVKVEVEGVNTPPVANDDYAYLVITASIKKLVPPSDAEISVSVLNNDTDVEDTTPSLNGIVSGPSQGSASISGSNIVYDPNQWGVDSLVYQVIDNYGDTDTATLTINTVCSVDEDGNPHIVPDCCFPAGTMISMADGSLKPIEEIKKGDSVLSCDVETGEILTGEVSRFIIKQRYAVYEINDGLLSPTDDHPLYVRKSDGREGWAAVDPEHSKVVYSHREAMKLEVGDELFTSKGWVMIESIEKKPGSIETYTFTVDNRVHDYFANGVLVSNEATCIIYATEVEPVCCFPAGTKITLNDGSLKNIEDVKVGDFVLSCDSESGEFVSGRVVVLTTRQRSAVYEINDGLLSPTDDHPLYVRKGDGREGWASIDPSRSAKTYSYRDSMKLEVGDELFTSKGWIEIESIKMRDGEITTYTFGVSNSAHNFFANGVLASNGLKETGGVIDAGGGDPVCTGT